MHPNLVFKQYIAYIQDVQKLASKSIENRICFIKQFLQAIECEAIEELTIYQIDKYFALRSAVLKPESINTERRIIRLYLIYAKSYLQLPLKFDPAFCIKEMKVPEHKIKTFTPGQIRAVINNCKNYQDKLMIATLFEAGLRISELVMLQLDDISGTRLQIKGKGGKVRLTFVTPMLANKLKEHAARRGITEGAIFRHNQIHCNVRTNHFHADTVRQRIKRAFRNVGLEMHPHQLRHSFATDLLEEGADLRTVQKLLGHANLNTTMRYLQVTDNYLEKVFQEHRALSVA